MLEVGVEADVLDLFDLVVRVVHHFQVRGRCEVQHLLDSVVAGVELDEMFDVSEVDKGGQRIVRHIDVLQVLVTPHSLAKSNVKDQEEQELTLREERALSLMFILR